MKSTKRLKVFLLSVSFFLLQLPLFSQSNELIDKLLGERHADFGDAVYLVLAGANLVDKDATVTDAGEVAINYLKKSGWKVRIKKPDEEITLGEYSLVIMKAFKITGGIMYTIFPCPRYASRELYYLGFVTGSKDPFRRISGMEAVSILQSVMEWKEASK